jgi:hypothetical protein
MAAARPDGPTLATATGTRGWDTRAGSIELAIPKLRAGSYFPEWLLERRKRAEKALVTVVATSYLLGVSTRRMDKLVQQFPGLGDGQGTRRARRVVPHPGHSTLAPTRSWQPTR